MRQSCGRISAWNICLQDACVEYNRTIIVPLVRRCREHDRLLSSCFRIYTYEFVPDIKGDLVLNDVFIFVRLIASSLHELYGFTSYLRVGYKVLSV